MRHSAYLKHHFTIYNRRYFGGKLPDDTRVGWSEEVRRYAVERVHVHGKTKCSERDCRTSFIKIHPDLKKVMAMALMTLLHAMIHLDGKLTHGPKFQGSMKRLAAKGAFRDLW
jgi:hypothetical protein